MTTTDTYYFRDVPTPQLPRTITRYMATIFPNHEQIDVAMIDGFVTKLVGAPIINHDGDIVGRIEDAWRKGNTKDPYIDARFVLNNYYYAHEVRFIDDGTFVVRNYGPKRIANDQTARLEKP